MSRIGRIVIVGIPHHVTQRGNRHTDVFKSDEDRLMYLGFLKKYSERHELAVWAYCLMNNHVHLIVVPMSAESLGRTLRDTHTMYAMYFNERVQETGHLWQGRFYSCPMDEAHLWAAVRYVERNPVRTGLVERSEDYHWSSAQGHCGLEKDTLLSKNFPPSGIIEDWAAWLAQGDDEIATRRLRLQTVTGRPCGSDAFIKELEDVGGRNR